MPGKKGKITQSKKAKVAVYLSDVVRMFKMEDNRIRFSTEKLIASINKDGRVTNGKRLYKILDTLYKREHRKLRKAK
ncbi:hypothetical protein ACFL96_20415 [Thermoproteota archaeon]